MKSHVLVYSQVDSTRSFDSLDDLVIEKGRDWLSCPPSNSWIDFSNASNKQLGMLGDIFNMHPLTVEDLKEASGQGIFHVFYTDRETCLDYEKYLQIVLQTVKISDRAVSVHSYSLSPIICLVFDSLILTFHSLGNQHSTPLLSRLDMQLKRDVSPEKILSSLIQHVFDFIVPFSRQLVSLCH